MLVAAESYSHHFQQDDATSSIGKHVGRSRSRRCTDVEEWGYHRGPEEHLALIALRVSSPGRHYCT